jgi:hypothetical protein
MADPGVLLLISLDRVATVEDAHARELRGDHLRLMPLDVQRFPAKLSAVNLGGTDIPLFTITAEHSQPPLTIVRVGSQVVLSWPSYAQGFVLQSTPVLGAGFTTVSEQVTHGENFYTVTLPVDPSSNRFFRLALDN